MDYEIYRYIDELAEDYIPLEKLLKQNNSTFNDAKQCIKNFREKFYSLLKKYSVRNYNIVSVCYDLMDRIYENPENPDLQYLYFCIMTDFGLLDNFNSSDYAEEQKIRNYFQQQKSLHELQIFLKSQTENNKKLNEIKEYLKKPRAVKNIECTDETDFLYHLTIQHTFLYENAGNNTYKDNLNALLMHINSDKILKSVKPYIIYAVLGRKHGMMQKREHFIPNFRVVFQYQSYNIFWDNGKNFNYYQSSLELYDHLMRSYSDESDIDIKLCNFCFANLSPLSEWYYENCEPNENIPMNIRRKISTVIPATFPRLFDYYDYGRLDDYSLQLYYDAEDKLKNQMLDAAEYMI